MLVPREAPCGSRLGSAILWEAKPGGPSLECRPRVPQTDLPPASEACWAGRPTKGKQHADQFPFTQNFQNTQSPGQVPLHGASMAPRCKGQIPTFPGLQEPTRPGLELSVGCLSYLQSEQPALSIHWASSGPLYLLYSTEQAYSLWPPSHGCPKADYDL